MEVRPFYKKKSVLFIRCRQMRFSFINYIYTLFLTFFKTRFITSYANQDIILKVEQKLVFHELLNYFFTRIEFPFTISETSYCNLLKLLIVIMTIYNNTPISLSPPLLYNSVLI